MKRLGLWLLVILSFVGLFRIYANSQFPYSHDGENHLARFANYKIALKEGQFPPRFAPNLLNHYGYPVFNYNYPLANILSVPFSAIGISYGVTFKVLVVFSVILGSIGVFYWLDKLKIIGSGRVIAIVAWIINPYLINLVFFRGNIGEILAYSIFPWIFWSFEFLKNNQDQRFFPKKILLTTILFSLLFLSHNLTAILSIALILVLGIIRLWNDQKAIIGLLLSVLWAIFLTFWFWFPAIAEMKMIVLGSAASVSDFSFHFPILSQLLWAPLGFGFSYPGSVDSLSFAAGLPSVLALLFFIFLWKKKKDSYLVVFFVLTFFLIFIQSAFSLPIWSFFKPLEFIQFPWRLSIFIATLSVPVIAVSINRSSFAASVITLLLLIQLIVIFRLHPADYFHKTNLDLDVFSQTTSTQNENMPVDLTFEGIGNWQPAPTPLSGKADFSIDKWNGTSRSYQVQVTEEAVISEPTAYFPGWETWVEKDDGSREQLVGLEKSKFIEEAQGRIAYELPAGEYYVQTKFTQNTPARIIGNSVSALSFLGLISYFLWLKRTEKHS